MTIALETLAEFFENARQLKRDGRAPFDVDAQCRWSFFFVDTDGAKLAKVARHLETIGYEAMGFLEPNPEDEDRETIFLRVDRVETHSLESLHERNRQLDELAARFGIAGYDGMDVGAVDGP